MSSSHKHHWRGLLFLVAIVLLVIGGCGTNAAPEANTKFKPVDEEPEKPAKSDGTTERPAKGTTEEPVTQETRPTRPTTNKANAKPATKGTDSKDPALAGPTGDKVKLVRSLLRTIDSEPPGNTEQEKLASLRDQLEQILVTSEEILATEGAPKEGRDQALLARMMAAGKLLQYGLHKDAKQMLKVAAEELTEASNPQWATLGRVQVFKIYTVDELQRQPRDAKAVITALQTLLDAGGDAQMIREQVLPLVQQLGQFGYPEDSITALTMLADNSAASEDRLEALRGRQMQIEIWNVKLHRNTEVADDDVEQLMSKVKAFLAEIEDDPSGPDFVFRLALGHEGSNPKLASQLYDLIETTYSSNKNEEVVKKAEDLVAGGRQRLKLVGQPLVVEGELAEGQPFDWNDYKGKVVLVHFWALDSANPNIVGLNVQDLTNMELLHRRFHARGLEIVGVNVDDTVERLKALFENQQLAWPTVIGIDGKQRGVNQPTAKQVGLTAEAIPYHVLVGSDGKVVAVGLNGPELHEAIAKLLPAKDKTEKNKPEDTNEDPSEKGDKPGNKKDEKEGKQQPGKIEKETPDESN